jgi:hypothetical protein
VNHNDISGATRNTAVSNNTWKGQSSYAGARNNAQTPGLNQPAGHTASNTYAGAQPRVGGSGATRNPALADKASPSATLASTRTPTANSGASRSPAVDRGFGESNRAGQSAGSAIRDPGTAMRPAQQVSAAPRESAFSGANSPSGGGAFARASSARGNASAGHLGGGGARGKFGR